MNKDNWFEVSKSGLRVLQEGKPKWYIMRELIQNAFDENITQCRVVTEYNYGIAILSVEDDSPNGFNDLSDAYTLFGETYKRRDPKKRGRFNMGEKQALALCSEAVIITTKGTIKFTKHGRIKSRVKREVGSIITLKTKMTKEEYQEMLKMVFEIFPPAGVEFTINGHCKVKRLPEKTFEATLTTEIEEGGAFRKTSRKTKIELHNTKIKDHWLYEMGIPVQVIDCEYSIDVQQKIPLSFDRDTVLPSFLKDLYAEVLNQIHGEIEPESSSKLWVREAMSDERINGEAVKSVIKQRYGEKVVIANPFDKNSIDEAITNGYKVVSGSEMSAEEWANVKNADAMRTSTDMFGKTPVGCEPYPANADMIRVGEYARKLGKLLLGFEINTYFVKSKANEGASYGQRAITFNVSRLGKAFFKEYLNTTDLILHELGHQYGNHTEISYHRALTRFAQVLVKVALQEPDFFKLEVEEKV